MRRCVAWLALLAAGCKADDVDLLAQVCRRAGHKLSGPAAGGLGRPFGEVSLDGVGHVVYWPRPSDETVQGLLARSEQDSGFVLSCVSRVSKLATPPRLHLVTCGSVEVDGGTDAGVGPIAETPSCGCSTSGSAWWALLLSGALLLRRRRAPLTPALSPTGEREAH